MSSTPRYQPLEALLEKPIRSQAFAVPKRPYAIFGAYTYNIRLLENHRSSKSKCVTGTKVHLEELNIACKTTPAFGRMNDDN
ncbi:hypothetical protein [Phyllobacterium zundukense]|uniref:Uncharacterized protein n=1 Tax=Phyllobacterium zundukense TaxID=1867719 RepID=A0ACD4CYG8_9HYPH|nr:hypothetical protein [Phyllobacterium zundukense]UXN58606.1 hypothetical protein N8E88_11425 [Phyllobacterium zundukense]